MFQTLRTVTYHVKDIAKAKAWYTKMLGVKPYFDEPFYVGFNVGGFELGLDPNPKYKNKDWHGLHAYWSVKSVKSAHAKLLKLGAKKFTPIQDVGGGIVLATVKDPWGNVLGIIQEKKK